MATSTKAYRLRDELDSIEKIREAFQRVHDYAMHKDKRPYMSIPVDEDYDADCIITRAIDELAALREATAK